MSDATFGELNDVPLRAKFVAKYPYVTADRVAAFVAEIEMLSVRIPKAPRVLSLPRDPKDEPLIDLAVAGDARHIVTWNERHLTYLMKRDTPEGQEFCNRFPGIVIQSPPEFIAAIDARHSQASVL